MASAMVKAPNRKGPPRRPAEAGAGIGPTAPRSGRCRRPVASVMPWPLRSRLRSIDMVVRSETKPECISADTARATARAARVRRPQPGPGRQFRHILADRQRIPEDEVAIEQAGHPAGRRVCGDARGGVGLAQGDDGLGERQPGLFHRQPGAQRPGRVGLVSHHQGHVGHRYPSRAGAGSRKIGGRACRPLRISASSGQGRPTRGRRAVGRLRHACPAHPPPFQPASGTPSLGWASAPDA